MRFIELLTDWISALPADIFSIFLLSGDSSVVIETLARSELPARDMLCLVWSFKNIKRNVPHTETEGPGGPGDDEEERSDVSVESLPRLDSYQRILSWLSNCEYQHQNSSYPTQEDPQGNIEHHQLEENVDAAAIRKEMKDASKSCHPKKYIRPSKIFFRSRKNNSDRSYFST